MNKVKKWLNFENCFSIEPVGKAGGLTIFWNQEVKVYQILHTGFTVEVEIEDFGENNRWWMICIYAKS